MSDLISVQVIVYGRVQGVFFRTFTEQQAKTLGLTGYVRNLPMEAAVEVMAEGERTKLETLVGHLRAGPPSASVTRVATKWTEYTGSYADFSIKY
jgi:acylphosphatase